jgi:hypothetical protein
MEEKRKEKSREREREREKERKREKVRPRDTPGFSLDLSSSYERSIEVAILIEKAKMPCAHALKLH